MSGRAKGNGQKVDVGSAGWFPLPHHITNSDEYRALSLRERAVLTAICGRFNGHNNGRITISNREIIQIVGGSTSGKSASAAIMGLRKANFIVLRADYPGHLAMAREYELTFVQTGEPRHRKPATNAWRWTDEERRERLIASEAKGSKLSRERKKRLADRNIGGAVLDPGNEKLSRQADPSEKETFAVADRRVTQNRENPGEKHSQKDAHISNPTTTNHPTAAVIDLSAHRSGNQRAIWSNEQLRQAALAFVEQYGRGASATMSKETRNKVLPGQISKFLAGKSLSDSARAYLQFALARLGALPREESA